MTGPYTDAAASYRADGYSPIPLPYGRKEAPPAGLTGYLGADVTAEQVAQWVGGGPRNVALRLPANVLGIDVDHYGVKTGGDTVAAAEERLGPLPPTWRSTSRLTDLVSGIRLFRVPSGRQWADQLGPDGSGVELIHHGHRYVVAAPSRHPEGRDYEWFDPDGMPSLAGPRVAELPALPEAWVGELDLGEAAKRDPKDDLTEGDVGAWLAALPDGEVSSVAERVLADAEEAFTGHESRHNVARKHALRLVRLGEQRHEGVPTALDTLHAMFSEALGSDRSPDGEWERLVSGAVAGVVAAPTPTAADVFDDLAEETEVLAAICQAARSRVVGPAALLCVVLARVLAELPPRVTLPAVVGGPASLNLGVALVGKSGGGKSALLSVSRDVLGVIGDRQKGIERNVGSGEGVAETFLVDELEIGTRGGTRKTGRKLLIPDPRRVMIADEVAQFDAISGRSGATLGPTLRSALTGGALGQENGTAERRRHVPEGAYRLVMVVGVQPTRSGALLRDADAGTPQRFVWVSVGDSDAPDEAPPWPSLLDELAWALPDNLPDTIDYPDHIKAEVRAVRRARLRDEEVDDRLGHQLLTRLKVAAAFALLHGEVAITDRWWALAGALVDRSTAVQDDCARVLASELQSGHNIAAVAKDRAEDAVADDKVKRAAKSMLRKIRDAGGDWVPWDVARPGPNLRDYAHDAVASLETSGQIEVEHYENVRGTDATRYRYAGS